MSKTMHPFLLAKHVCSSFRYFPISKTALLLQQSWNTQLTALSMGLRESLSNYTEGELVRIREKLGIVQLVIKPTQ